MTAVASGNLLYLMVAALLALFWRHRRGHARDELLARATHEHHRVHRVLAQHPRRAA